MSRPAPAPRDDPALPQAEGQAPPAEETRARPVPEVEGPAARAGEKPPAEAKEKEKRGGPLRFFRELPGLIIIAFVLALLIKTFLVQAFFIPSISMDPTLEVGDRVLVNKVVYRLHPPRRGDVIVFENPNPIEEPGRNPFSAFYHWVIEGLGLSAPPDRDFIKRVIGLPGETVEIRDGVVYIDGRALAEPYLPARSDMRDFPPTRVPEGTLFVMGDNRLNSNDSRFSLGPVPIDRVVGKAFLIIWPPSRVGGVSG